jgi:YidC/Oxa1 family membrane protein insertase
MTEIWNIAILQPMMNGLIALSQLLWNNFGLAIIVLTVVVRIVLMPLTFQQTKSTKAMQSLQPKMQEIQKKYARNQQKMQEEMMRLYKEAGINPLGCMWPMLIQLPIWIALYQSIMQALAATPENLLALSQHLYQWDMVDRAIPLNEDFLGLRLSQPDPTLILAILVGVTMWVQQKMVTAPTTDPRQQQMSSMTTMMMPMMFAFFTLSFPSGLALYWVVSNIIGIGIQYVVGGGWGYFTMPSLRPQPQQQPQPAAQQKEKEGTVQKQLREGSEKDKKKDKN